MKCQKCEASAFRCDECSRPAKVLMKIGTDPDDWVYSMCDVCLEYLCPRHTEEGEDGRVVCDTCYQQAAMLRLRG
jgi:hypothetical protein